MMGIPERFEIIPMTTQWLGEVERVERLCFSSPWSRAGLAGDILGKSSRWYGAAESSSGRLAAFLGAHVFGDEGEIVNIATDPAYRRLGLAACLIRHFFGENPALCQVFLEVRKSNEAAIRLYAGFGFAAYATRPGYYENPREDALLMRLRK